MVFSAQPGRQCCHTPIEIADDTQHRAHHWRERWLCVGFCTLVHVVYEVSVAVMRGVG